MDLNGSVVLITGAGGAIAQSATRAFIEAEDLLDQLHCTDDERPQAGLDAQSLSLAALRRLLDSRAAG